MRPFTKYIVLGGLAAVISALVLAACGSSDSGSNDNAASAASTGGVVSEQSVNGTDVLADAQGRTLYSADVEQSGMIKCTGMCTSIWAPAAGSASQAKSAAADLGLKLGTVKRPDGASQLTFDGRPLYTFTQEGPGQLDGNGVTDQFNGTNFKWTAATTGGAAAPSQSGSSGYGSGYGSGY
jgi:predicted lipoprotein with Yx(FWY)xxD motif